MLIYDDEQFLQKRDAFEEIRFLKAAVSLLISSSIVKTNGTDVEVKNVHNSNYWSFFLRLVILISKGYSRDACGVTSVDE